MIGAKGAARTLMAQTLMVLPGAALFVVDGANLGDTLAPADEMQPCDIYRLDPRQATPRALRVLGAKPFVIAEYSPAGRPGGLLHLDCCATLMAADGSTAEILVLVETDPEGLLVAVYALPLAPLQPGRDYALIGTDGDALARYARAACVSFTRGTRITLAGGAQVPVEALSAGSPILTRDDGPQPLRWIGHHTVRATGPFAPIRIRAGTLNNEGDLIVSPDHRLLVYQRRDAIGAGRAEVMVRARQLVNGDSVARIEGGFVDYFRMLFDRHQIVYAEGIAAESMLVDERTSAALPDAAEPGLLLPAHRHSAAGGFELGEGPLDPDAADRLRRASLG
ncbi:Hint domain-containing protein [Citreimonas salinaria]|uniref:Hint domain-containing protein n=1 Tax=Citreimonas salinaria TaxID=321339 RepID=A0A1H3GB07_9RHOB|nr:Hint domain-containing protein [Citreimonas salinaria]SDY00513.1 Hint domain-containing protein [Citreimonas salinaria]